MAEDLHITQGDKKAQYESLIPFSTFAKWLMCSPYRALAYLNGFSAHAA